MSLILFQTEFRECMRQCTALGSKYFEQKKMKDKKQLEFRPLENYFESH